MLEGPSLAKKKILISGAGVAGIVCALSLDPSKHEIEIVERADSFRNIGFSVVLWKSGFDILKDIFNRNGQHFIEGRDYFPVNSFRCFGGIKLEKRKKLPSSGYAWVMEREHLMNILEEALFSNIKAEQLSFSTTIENIQYQGEKVRARFSTGMTKEYDFIIIAEGINSTTRRLLFPTEERIIPLGQNLRYIWFDEETNLEDAGALFFTQHHVGVIHPPYTRNLLGYYFKDGTSLEKQKAFEEKMFRVIKRSTGQETSLDHDSSRVFDLKNVYLPQYHRKRVVLIGDAAHGRPPTLGFGTSLALEDSIAICKILNTADVLDGVEPMLQQFSETRARRVKKVYRLQNFLHKFITGNTLKVRALSTCLQIFAGSIFTEVKKLAS